jgi:hypothetical protein
LLAIRIVWLVLLLGLTAASPAGAHPADEPNVYHLLWIELDTRELRLWDSILVGGLVADRAWAEIDTDHDLLLSPAEQSTYARSLAHGFRVFLDGRPLPLALKDYRFPTRDGFYGRAMTEDLNATQLHLRAPLPLLRPGLHRVRVENRNSAGYSCIFPQPMLRAPGFDTSLPAASPDGRTTEFRFRRPGQSGGSQGSTAAAPGAALTGSRSIRAARASGITPRGKREPEAASREEMERPGRPPAVPGSGTGVAWAVAAAGAAGVAVLARRRFRKLGD